MILLVICRLVLLAPGGAVNVQNISQCSGKGHSWSFGFLKVFINMGRHLNLMLTEARSITMNRAGIVTVCSSRESVIQLANS